MELEQLVQPHLLKMKAYQSARDTFAAKAAVMLDANENPLAGPTNRYPDPRQYALKEKLATLKGLSPDHFFLGNGSDEAIDLLIRLFCEPGKDRIILLPPTYGMYQVCANLSNVEVQTIPLTENFQLPLTALLARNDPRDKLLFICSPNNPTGNLLPITEVEQILQRFPGIVVVDEAYIDFAGLDSCISLLEKYPRLVVLQTFSKAWGMAGIRLGMAIAQPPLIAFLNKIKPPYNINQLTQESALQALEQPDRMKAQVQLLIRQRAWLAEQLASLPRIKRVFPSDANFLLIKIDNPKEVYQALLSEGIVVRDRSDQPGCAGCLRITIGTPEENQRVLDGLKTILNYAKDPLFRS